MKKLFFSVLLTAMLSAVWGQTYTTLNPGNWSSASTWSGGNVPPASVPAGATVNIFHKVIYNLPNELDIRGSVIITGDTLRFKNDNSAGTGQNIYVRSTGFFQVVNGGIIMPVYKTDGSNNNGNFITEGGRVVIFNSLGEFGQNW